MSSSVTQKIIVDQHFIAQLIAIARDAGAAILAIYNAPETINVQIKSDDSPVTTADIMAHDITLTALIKLLPIPIISEEAKLPAYAERKHWQEYWLVDPLDGTKEFIARTGEFTVNIALVQQGVPVLGIVHVPVLDESYVGVIKTYEAAGDITQENNFLTQLSRAEKYRHGNKIADLKTRNLTARFSAQQSLDVLASARHGGEAVAVLMQKIMRYWPAPVQFINAGSSLKFCWIAEGRADFYPRLAPTSEWDTAAAQAVLVAAGGAVVNAKNLAPLIYNGAENIFNGVENLLNPFFFAMGDVEFDWSFLLSDSAY